MGEAFFNNNFAYGFCWLVSMTFSVSLFSRRLDLVFTELTLVCILSHFLPFAIELNENRSIHR